MRRKSVLLGRLIFVLVIMVVLVTAVACPSTTSPTTTTSTGTATASPTRTATATATATVTASPTRTASPSGSATATATATATTSPRPSGTATATATAVVPPISGTATPSGSATAAPSGTASPSVTSSPSGTASPGALGSVEVLGVWGSEELASFQAMVAPWEQQTGGKMNFTGTRDLTAVLTTRIQAGNPPDIAILPNPGLMTQFANQGKLQALNPMLNMTTINQQYPSSWLSLGTINNNLYAIFMKAANKSMIWYNPKTFSTNSWQIPSTWDDLIALSNKIVSDAKTPANPWSIGVENGAATGWPATDWIAQIFLTKYGGAAYDQWVAHQIPWTDPRIKDAWNMFGTIVNTPNFVPGGATAALATNFQDASFLPFQTPPKAAMYYEGDFVEGFIKTQFPNLVAGQDFDFFAFPTISGSASPSGSVTASASASASAAPSASASASASPTVTAGVVTGGADLVCAFKDNPTVRSFVAYLATPQAQDIWVKRGGFTSINKQVSLSDYPDPIAQKSAQQLLNASLFRFGAGDSMPGAMQTAWWAAIQQYLQNPGQLDTILTNLENTAKTAYSASPAASGSPSASTSPPVSASPSASATP